MKYLDEKLTPSFQNCVFLKAFHVIVIFLGARTLGKFLWKKNGDFCFL